MKTEALDYNAFYSHSLWHYRRIDILDISDNSYNLSRKTEYLAYLVALETGLRVSDLLNLKFNDFSKNENIGAWCFNVDIKKTKSNHTGTVSSELYHTIKHFNDYILENSLIGLPRSEYIFWNYKSDKLYTRQWLHKRIKLVGEKLGFKNCGVHSIRKASAINVLDKSGSLSLAQYHLTHKRATTTDKYLGITKTSALEKLAKIHR